MRPLLSRRLPLAVLCVCVLAPSLSGCVYIGAGVAAIAAGGGGSSSGGRVNQPPAVQFPLTPAPAATDLVATVDYLLIDPEGLPIDLAVEYSTDGAAFFTATEGPGSDGTFGLDSSPAGRAHVFAWNFFSDLFSNDFNLLQSSSFDVTLRFTSDDGVTRQAPPVDQTNFRVGNLSPIVSINPISVSPVDPTVVLDYTVLDDFSDPLDVLVEFTLDRFATAGQPATILTPASPGCADGVTGVSSSQTGAAHCFEWDYQLDIPSSATPVIVRITVTDTGSAVSAPAVSQEFRLGNTAPLATLDLVDTQFGVNVDFTLIDDTSDISSVTFDYSLDDGQSYTATTALVGSATGLAASPGGEPHNIAWNSLADVGVGTFNTVKVRLTPSDLFSTGLPVQSATFSLQNTDQPLAFITSPQGGQVTAGDVSIGYLLVDATGDLSSIVVEYRAGGAPAFAPVTPGPGGDGDTGLTSSQTGSAHTYVWDSLTDLGPVDLADVQVRITPSDVSGAGPASVQGPFRTDNNAEPTLQALITPTSPATQNIAFLYDIADPEGDPADIEVLYSTDGGATFPDHCHEPPVPGSDGIVGLASSPGGTSHVFLWDSVRDIGLVTQSNLVVQITPTDNPDPALGLGTLALTASFVLDNDPASAPPTLLAISPSQGDGAGLNSVVITGTGFIQGTTAQIGGAALLNESLVNVTTITGDVPPYVSGPTVVDVTVTSPNGTAVLTNGYTYLLGPSPCNITLISPSFGTVGGGTTVTIDGSGFRPGGLMPTVTFGGRSATVDISTTDTQIICTTPLAPGLGPADIDVIPEFGNPCIQVAGFIYDNAGTLDAALGAQGWVTHDNAALGMGDETGMDAALDASGRLVVVGKSFGVNDDMAIWRYNVDLTLDTTFNGQGYLTDDGAAGGAGTDRGNGVVIDAAGRIIVGGFSRGPGVNGSDMTVWAFNPDGTPDSSFGTNGVFAHHNAAGGADTDECRDIAIDAAGNFVVAGFSVGANLRDLVVWRLTPSGALDPTFNGQGFITHDSAAGGLDEDRGRALTIEPSGRILVTGWSFNGLDEDMVLWAILPAGTLDPSFNGQGWVVDDNVAGGMGSDRGEGVVVMPSGRILVAGQSAGTNLSDMVIWAFDPSGALDPGFGTGGIFLDDDAAGGAGGEGVRGFALDGAGQILVSGRSSSGPTTVDMTVWRLDPAGVLDATFGKAGVAHVNIISRQGVGNQGDHIIALPTGKIAVVGDGPGANLQDMVVWRLNGDGNFDRTVAPGPGFVVHDNAAGGVGEDLGLTIAVDSSGRILVSGRSMNISGGDELAVWAYDPGGILDPSFGTGGIFLHDAAAGGVGLDESRDMAIDAMGRIVITGNSINVPGDSDMVVWRLTPDGLLDTTFNAQGFVVDDGAAGGFAADAGWGLALEAGGRILVAGFSTNGLGNRDLAVWAFDVDGAPDGTFGTGGVLTHDDAAGGGGDDEASGMTLDASGRLLIAGRSRNLAGDMDVAVWRLTPAGLLDTTFNGQGWVATDLARGGPLNDEGKAIDVDASGRIIVAGWSDTTPDSEMLILAYDSAGTLDPTFGAGGIATHGSSAGGVGDVSGRSVRIDTLGRILVGGWGPNPLGDDDTIVWRFDAMGNLDATFAAGGVFVHPGAAGGTGGDLCRDIAIDSSGRILITGQSPNPSANADMVIWRLE